MDISPDFCGGLLLKMLAGIPFAGVLKKYFLKFTGKLSLLGQLFAFFKVYMKGLFESISKTGGRPPGKEGVVKPKKKGEKRSCWDFKSGKQRR
ncbi:hypothetical protein D5272_05500 [bacterium D16-76]|nr:hypothetical protein [bacterium D16-76]